MIHTRPRLPKPLNYKPRPISVTITVHSDGTFTVKENKRDGYTLAEIKQKFLPNADFDEPKRTPTERSAQHTAPTQAEGGGR